MKLMIASDLHGSAPCCAQLLEAYRREAPERLVLLGDYLYHGPRNELPEGYDPKRVIALLSPVRERLFCVRGNCDSEVDQMVLPFPILAPYALLFADGRTLLATHGHLDPATQLPPLCAGTILLSGHTHVPSCRDYGDYLSLNPGSVSLPKEDSPRGYLILEDARLQWKTLSGRVWMEHTL